MSVYVENGIGIEIHFTNEQETEMMVYLPDKQKTYFVSVEGYDYQLRMVMKSPYTNEIVVAIQEFLIID